MRCPDCSSRATRQGTKSRRILELDADGRPLFRATRVQRWRCQGTCKAYFTSSDDLVQPGRLATIEARDAVAMACFDGGYASAAAKFGIDGKTAKSLWSQWASLRESDLPSQLPSFMGLHLAHVAGAERTIVTDIEEKTVVDLLDGSSSSAIEAWLERMDDPSRVEKVAVSLHGPYGDAIARHLPYADILICREHAQAAIEQTYARAFSASCKPLEKRPSRNAREDPGLFSKRAHDLSDPEREQMSGWSDDILALYDAKEATLFALALRRPQDAVRMLDEASHACRRLLGVSCGISSLLDTWKEEMAAGVLEATSSFTALLSELLIRLQDRRPRLPFPLARGLLVLKEDQRAAYERLTILPEDRGYRGVDMEDAINALAVP